MRWQICQEVQLWILIIDGPCRSPGVWKRGRIEAGIAHSGTLVSRSGLPSTQAQLLIGIAITLIVATHGWSHAFARGQGAFARACKSRCRGLAR